jgi:hypothetical protein
MYNDTFGLIGLLRARFHGQGFSMTNFLFTRFLSTGYL